MLEGHNFLKCAQTILYRLGYYFNKVLRASYTIFALCALHYHRYSRAPYIQTVKRPAELQLHHNTATTAHHNRERVAVLRPSRELHSPCNNYLA